MSAADRRVGLQLGSIALLANSLAMASSSSLDSSTHSSSSSARIAWLSSISFSFCEGFAGEILDCICLRTIVFRLSNDGCQNFPQPRNLGVGGLVNISTHKLDVIGGDPI